MQYSAARTWQDMAAMLATHKEMLVAVAGVLLLLPALAWGLFVPKPVLNPDGKDAFAILSSFVSQWWWAMFAVMIASMLNALVTASIALRPAGQTAGNAMRWAAGCFPSGVGVWMLNFTLIGGVTLLCLVLATLIGGMILGDSPMVGLFAFPAFIPALYLTGRTMVALPAIVADPQPNPMLAFRRSFALSAGKGWQVASGFFTLLLVLMLASAIVLGIARPIFAALLPVSLADALLMLLSACLTSISGVLTALYGVAAYRQLKSP